MTEKYKISMIVGYVVGMSKNDNLYNIREWDWHGTEECASFSETVINYSKENNIDIMSAAAFLLDKIANKELELKVKDHGYDDYAKGFLAGEIIGFPTVRNLKICRVVEDVWCKYGKQYGYYQEVLNEAKDL